MNVNSSLKPAAPLTKSLSAKASESQLEEKPTIVVDLTEIGDKARRGVGLVAGTATSIFMAPRTVLAPTLAAFGGETPPATTEADAALVGGAIVGGGVGLYVALQSGIIKGVAGGFAGGVVGAFVAGLTTATLQEFNAGLLGKKAQVFNYDSIQNAREQAHTNAPGSQKAKNGAAFAAGYIQAAKDGYQMGPNAVDEVVDLVSGGINYFQGGINRVKGVAQGTTEFVGGMFGEK